LLSRLTRAIFRLASDIARDQQEDQRGDRRRQAEVLPGILEGDAVGVADQDVGGAGRDLGVEESPGGPSVSSEITTKLLKL
jgi:hypothetical protein